MGKASKLLVLAAGCAGLATLGGCQPAGRAATAVEPTHDLERVGTGAARPLLDREGRPACGNVMLRTARPRQR